MKCLNTGKPLDEVSLTCGICENCTNPKPDEANERIMELERRVQTLMHEAYTYECEKRFTNAKITSFVKKIYELGGKP